MLKMKTLTVGNKTYQLWDPEAAHVDDTVVGENPWSSKQIMDALCPPISQTGPVVSCQPVKNYPLGVVTEINQETDTLTLQRSGENMFDIRRLLVSNGTDSWTQDETGAYVGKPRVLYDVYGNHTEGFLRNCFAPNTRYVLRVESKCPTNADGTLMFYVTYTDGTKECILMQKNNTDYTVGTGVTAVGKTVQQLSVSLQYNTITYVRSICLCQGNTGKDLPFYGETLTAPLGKTVEGGSYDWSTGILTEADGTVSRLTPVTVPGWEGVNTLWSSPGQTTVTGRRDVRSLLEKLSIS